MFTFLALLAPTVAALTTIAAGDPRYVTALGRTSLSPSTGALSLSWLGGGLSVSHTGSVLRLTAQARTSRSFKLSFYQSTQDNLPYEGTAWVPASGANETIVIASGAGGVQVLLNDPPDYWAGAGDAAVLLSLTTDGAFLPLPPPPQRRRVLHVLGDSITAATNIRGGFRSCADGGLYADYSSSWGGILCSFFGASCTTVAVGGKGLVRNCCDSGTTIPQYYTQDRKGDADGSFAFADQTPDAMAVYLGTNDYSGKPPPGLDALFTAALLGLMRNVTQRYYGTPASPANVTFLAILGPMSPTLPSAALAAAVAQGTAQGFRVLLVNASTACGSNLTGCTDGCASHPGVASHRNIARMVAPAVEAALGWPSNGVI